MAFDNLFGGWKGFNAFYDDDDESLCPSTESSGSSDGSPQEFGFSGGAPQSMTAGGEMTGEMNAYERLHFGHRLSFRGGLVDRCQHDQDQRDRGGGGGGKRQNNQGPLMGGMSGLESWRTLETSASNRDQERPSAQAGAEEDDSGYHWGNDLAVESEQIDNLRGQDPNRGAETRTQPKWWIGTSRNGPSGATTARERQASAPAQTRQRTGVPLQAQGSVLGRTSSSGALQSKASFRSVSQPHRSDAQPATPLRGSTATARRAQHAQAVGGQKPNSPVTAAAFDSVGYAQATRRSTSNPISKGGARGGGIHVGAPPGSPKASPTTVPARGKAGVTGRAFGFHDAETNRLLRLKFEAGNGTVKKMRYVSCEALGWAYVSTPGSANPISEVRCFRFIPETRQLVDQNGIGGILPEYHLSRRLKEIVAFASYCMIAHNITLPSTGVLNVPTQAPRILPRYNQPKSPWDLFKAWLGGGGCEPVVSWTVVQGAEDIDIAGERIAVPRGKQPGERVCVAKAPVRGSAVYEMAVLQGTKGINIGVVSGETPRLRRSLNAAGACVYGCVGEVWRDGRELVGAAAYSTGDVITLHVEADVGTVYWARNGVRQYAVFTKLQGPFYVAVGITEPGTAVEIRSVTNEGHVPRLPTPLKDFDHDTAHDTVSQKGTSSGVISRTMITTTLRSSARTLVGPVDLYLPAGCSCSVADYTPSPTDPPPPANSPVAIAEAHDKPLHLHIERLPSKWTETLPENSDMTEPHRSLGGARNGGGSANNSPTSNTSKTRCTVERRSAPKAPRTATLSASKRSAGSGAHSIPTLPM
eukprot:TRINITY_DN9178_c0_g1_i2.p1 TRINITY_DN9178_c0_g1~~TRINITY_DN9178_c0_g1_i2.p1  ORF type:complete len:812 (+),score=121.34 TRINITY_DN9178_c0_g1_i2:109-2544(+)